MSEEKKPSDKLLVELKRKLQFARRQKMPFELDMRECYYFAAPHRARSVNSYAPPPIAKTGDAALLCTSFAFELCADFPTVMINTFCPENQAWIVRRAGPMVPDEMRAEVEEAAAEADEKVFKSILSSNFYAEIGKAFNPDLALGTVGVWIEHPNAWEPPVVQAVPIREIEINIGPTGEIDDRFIVRHTKYVHLPAVLPGIKIPDRLKQQVEEHPEKRVVVVWSFWRLRTDDNAERWQHAIMVGQEHIVHQAVLEGHGSCPFIVARFNATPEWAWGVGPLIQALPDLRQIDILAERKVKSVDLHLQPPVSYPDGSFINLQDGIEAGMAYPIRPGEEGAIKNIYNPPSLDAAIWMTQDIEMRVKRLFFLDWPQQRGDTPPTATQWLDEMTLAQRRIGTPGLIFWREFCAGVFQRFLFLLEKAGQVDPILVKTPGGLKKPVTLMPYNPAQRSAEQEEVALFTRFVQVAASAFPEEWKISTDGQQTIENVANKMGVNQIWAKRDPQQVAAAMDQIKQMMGGAAAGGAAIPGQAGPQPEAGGMPVPVSVQGQGL